jgi:alkanesulfonate monooxygenase SsuD/methylene tetrahydromethanopterin reductase-like flavin-dependent oxidoreductase (luciferase family)
MRFGIYVNLFWHPDGRPAMPEAVEQAQACEQAGFDWLVLGERHHHPAGYHEILSSAGWLAAHTSRIGIATAGIVLPLYSPVLLAEMLAHLDVLSGGRLTPGFVLGYRPEEFAAMQVRRADRVARFTEGLAIIKALWTGAPTTFHGAHNSLDDVLISPIPAQLPRPRIWNGGRVPAAIRRTAAECDGWTTSFNEEPDDLARAISYYRELPDSAGSLGRDVIMMREGFCAPTTQAARSTLEGPLQGLYADYTSWKRDSADVSHYRNVDWETMQRRFVIGSPEQVCDAVGRYAEMGSDGLVLRIQPPGLAHSDAMRCIELLATEVLPKFR